MHAKTIEALIQCKPCNTSSMDTYVYGKVTGRFAGSKKKRKIHKKGK